MRLVPPSHVVEWPRLVFCEPNPFDDVPIAMLVAEAFAPSPKRTPDAVPSAKNGV